MKPCKCVSCSISRALEKGEVPIGLSNAFLLGYYYFGMAHLSATEDAGWYAEGVDFYSEQLLKSFSMSPEIKKLIKIIREAKDTK